METRPTNSSNVVPGRKAFRMMLLEYRKVKQKPHATITSETMICFGEYITVKVQKSWGGGIRLPLKLFICFALESSSLILL